MADYSIITRHTEYGNELMKEDPSLSQSLVNDADAKVKESTNGNYGISSVYIDFENGMTYYDLEPLTSSAKSQLKQVSLGIKSAGWFDTIKNIISVIVATAAFIIGALVGGWALLAGSIIAGAILLFSYITNKIEYTQNIVETDDEYSRQLRDGEITQEQYEEFTASKHKVMEETSGDIPWTAIIIGGMVGLLGLGALMILTRKQ